MNIISAKSEIRIEREPEVVFAYFADLRNEPEWNRGHVRNVIMTSSEPIGLGTTFEGEHHGFGKATWRLAEYDPPRHIIIEGLTGTAPYRYVGDFERKGNATMFRGCIEWEPRGAWCAFGLLLPLILKFQAKRSFQHLRDALQLDERSASIE
jgi:hypothetical protein